MRCRSTDDVSSSALVLGCFSPYDSERAGAVVVGSKGDERRKGLVKLTGDAVLLGMGEYVLPLHSHEVIV